MLEPRHYMNFLDTETSQYCSFASIYHAGKIKIEAFGDGVSVMTWPPLNDRKPYEVCCEFSHTFFLKCDRVEVDCNIPEDQPRLDDVDDCDSDADLRSDYIAL